MEIDVAVKRSVLRKQLYKIKKLKNERSQDGSRDNTYSQNFHLPSFLLKFRSSLVDLPMATEDAVFTFRSIGIITHRATSAISARVMPLIHLLPMTTKDASLTPILVGIITHRSTAAISFRWIPSVT